MEILDGNNHSWPGSAALIYHRKKAISRAVIGCSLAPARSSGGALHFAGCRRNCFFGFNPPDGITADSRILAIILHVFGEDGDKHGLKDLVIVLSLESPTAGVLDFQAFLNPRMIRTEGFLFWVYPFPSFNRLLQ